MITIAERLRPFSHTAGSRCIIPGTDAILIGAPHRLQIGDWEIPLGNDPFVSDFTLQQDLERNCVWVFGNKYRIKIYATPDGFVMLSGKEKQFFPAKVRYYLPNEMERLSLGSHKSQDWDLMSRRRDLKEILPILFCLGQKIERNPLIDRRCGEQSCQSLDRMPPLSRNFLQPVEEFYRASFDSMLAPRKSGENVLIDGFLQVRSLFYTEEGNRLQLLPNNPFPEGRMLNIQTMIGSLDIEWTKKKLRRAVLRPRESGTIIFDLPKEIRSFRSKTHLHEKGVMHNAEEPFFAEKGATLFLDRFFE